MFADSQDILDHAETQAAEEGFQRAGGDDYGQWVDAEDGGQPEFVPAPPRTEQVIREFVISDNNRGRFEKNFAKLSRACARYGQTLSILHYKIVEVKHPLFRNRTVKRNAAVISLPPVVGERGSVIGHFERAEDNTSWYVHCFNEDDSAAVRAFAGREDQCDHCGFQRQRNQTFVVRSKTGDKLVARQCLLSYCGIDPLAALAISSAYHAVDSEESEFFFGRTPGSIHVETLVRTSFRVAKKLGGYSKQDSVRHVNLLTAGKPFATEGYEQREQQEIIDSYEGFDPECDLFELADYVETVSGEFGDNLRLVFGLEFCDPKRKNLVVAGVGLSVGRVLKRAQDAKEREALPTAKHLDAEVGKRVDLVGKVLRTHLYDGAYGTTCIVSIRCDDGTNLVNFHTGEKRPEANTVYAIRATVKKHENDKRTGEPVTVIGRAVYAAPPAQQPLL